MRQAAEHGQKPNRGKWSILGEEKYEEIRKMIREGQNDREVAAKVGCGQVLGGSRASQAKERGPRRPCRVISRGRMLSAPGLEGELFIVHDGKF